MDISIKGLLQFIYLEATVRNEGGNSSAITESIVCQYKALEGQASIERSKVENLQAPIRRVVTYGDECWTMTEADQNMVGRFTGNDKINEEEWRTRNNREINDILNGERRSIQIQKIMEIKMVSIRSDFELGSSLWSSRYCEQF